MLKIVNANVNIELNVRVVLDGAYYCEFAGCIIKLPAPVQQHPSLSSCLYRFVFQHEISLDKEKTGEILLKIIAVNSLDKLDER